MDIKELLDLQNELAVYNQQINDFICENQEKIDNDSLMDMKAEHIKQQISCMKQEIYAIEKSMDTQTNADFKKFLKMDKAMPDGTYNRKPAESIWTKQTHKPIKSKPNKTRTGITYILIIASALIFAGMFQFAMSVFSAIPPIIMACLMCIISVSVAAGSILLIRRRKQSMAGYVGCAVGSGMIYVSVMAGGIFMHAWDGMTSMILLCVWAAAIQKAYTWINRETGKGTFLAIIGNTGVLLSALMGPAAGEPYEFLVPLFVTIACIVVNNHPKLKVTAYWFAAADTVLLVMSNVMLTGINSVNGNFSIYLSMFPAVLWYFIATRNNRNRLFVHIAASISGILMIICVAASTPSSTVALVCISIGVYAFVIRLFTREMEISVFTGTAPLFIALWAAFQILAKPDGIANGLLFPILLIPVLVHGMKKEKLAEILTVCLLTVASIAAGNINVWGLTGVLVLSLSYIILCRFTSGTWKNAIPFPILLISVIIHVNAFAKQCIHLLETGSKVYAQGLITGGLANMGSFIFASLLLFLVIGAWKEKCKHGPLLEIRIFMSFAMFLYGASILVINRMPENMPENMFATLFMFGIICTIINFYAVTCLNLFILVHALASSPPAQIWVSIKYPATTAVFLITSRTPWTGISIAMILMYTVLMLFGMKQKFVYMGGYSLAMSFIFTLKLFIADLWTDSSLLNAALLIGCGIVEFGIAFLYMYNKKHTEENKPKDTKAKTSYSCHTNKKSGGQNEKKNCI